MCLVDKRAETKGINYRTHNRDDCALSSESSVKMVKKLCTTVPCHSPARPTNRNRPLVSCSSFITTDVGHEDVATRHCQHGATHRTTKASFQKPD